MANTLRFSLLNKAATATLKNDTGGGAPARGEVAPWVMENAQNQDRFLLWQYTGTINYDVDFGADVPLRLFATLGARSAPPGGSGITGVEIFTCTSAAGYPAGLVTRGTYSMAAGQRDGYLLLGGNTSWRYLRFAITAGTAFTLGRIFAGVVDVDLLVKYSPGRQRTLLRPTQRNTPGTGAPLITRIGDDYFRYSMPYNSALESMRANLFQVASANDIVMIDRDDTIKQMVLADDQFNETHLFDAPDQHNATLELQSLG